MFLDFPSVPFGMSRTHGTRRRNEKKKRSKDVVANVTGSGNRIDIAIATDIAMRSYCDLTRSEPTAAPRLLRNQLDLDSRGTALKPHLMEMT
jgi:hypothetical protein